MTTLPKDRVFRAFPLDEVIVEELPGGMFNVLSGQHRLKLMLNIGCPVLARELITGKNVVIMPEPLPPQEPKIGWVKEKPIEAPGFEPKNNNRNKRRRHQRRRNYHPQNG